MGEISRNLISPTYEEIIAVNELHIATTGGFHNGTDNLQNLNSLYWAVDIIRGPLFSFDPYPTTIEKACILSYTIIRSHVFFDGNKRTGSSVLKIFLRLNGYEIFASDDEIITTTLQIAGDRLPVLSFAEYVDWTRERIQIMSPR